MRKKREFIEGVFYHVTSRANNKNRVFERRLGQKIMILTLEDAKEKFGFCLTNFCIMPTHIHLLIRPENGTCLSKIMHWIKHTLLNGGISFMVQTAICGDTGISPGQSKIMLTIIT